MPTQGSKMTSTKKVITEGTELRIAESGYYGFWYPHADPLTLEENIEVESIVNRKFVQSDEFIPCLVSAEVARKYGSPINVLWFRKK